MLLCIVSVSIFAALHILNAYSGHLSRIYLLCYARFVSFHFLFCALLCIYGNPKCNNFSSSIFGVLVFLLQHISRFLINAYGNLCVRTRSQTFPYNVNLDKERSSGSFFFPSIFCWRCVRWAMCVWNDLCQVGQNIYWQILNTLHPKWMKQSGNIHCETKCGTDSLIVY